ncbi:MAG: hypothetical protein QXF24_04955 [Thermoproteota archaeon]
MRLLGRHGLLAADFLGALVRAARDLLDLGRRAGCRTEGRVVFGKLVVDNLEAAAASGAIIIPTFWRSRGGSWFDKTAEVAPKGALELNLSSLGAFYARELRRSKTDINEIRIDAAP